MPYRLGTGLQDHAALWATGGARTKLTSSSTAYSQGMYSHIGTADNDASINW